MFNGWRGYLLTALGLQTRKGLTGLETAIILIAFIIASSAFTFIVLNMGMITSEKSQSVISTSMSETSSSLLLDSDVICTFTNNSGGQDSICLTNAIFYVRISQGNEPIDMDDSYLVITYTSPRCHGSMYETNGTITTVTHVTGDSDSTLDPGERFKVSIDLTELPKNSVTPSQTDRNNLYCHPYESIIIDLKPSQGASLRLDRDIPQVNNAMMTI